MNLDHVIGWTLVFVHTDETGSATISLTGQGCRGENPALYKDRAAADQQAAQLQPVPGSAWLVLPVMDQGDPI